MLFSAFFRLLSLLTASILCSLSIYLAYTGIITDNGILLLSFIAFIITTGVEAYRFSFVFWKKEDYFLGQLLPLVVYIIMGFLTCLLLPPVVFNRIFLPLRFAGCFGMRTNESIIVIGIVLIVIVTVLRFFGARSGYLFYETDISDNEDEF